MDADDIAVPHRIDEQIRYVSRHPETEVLSSDVSYVGVDGQLLYNPAPYRFSSRALRFLMFFLNPMCHPTVMGRREVFLKHPYSTQAIHCEDFELWHRMVEDGVIIRNLPERLLRFRSNAGSVSDRHQQEQVATYMRTSGHAIERYFGLRLEPDIHRILLNRMVHGLVRAADLRSAVTLFRDMEHEYVERERLSAADTTLIQSFSDRHLLNILLHGYRRSARDNSARRLAAREMVLMTLRNPIPTWLLAAAKGRERMFR